MRGTGKTSRQSLPNVNIRKIEYLTMPIFRMLIV